ncbi:hypothetical protein CFP56_010305 [Quercus suber]|uniref:Uncharacterized protein n=1 Tax=Quercus suber TaxID=58331 RepID=A0AAW0L0R7_QUESU
MKREGRQHGMVRTHRILPSSINPRPETRVVNKYDLPLTAGLFTKVPSKPTNHSKFTGKCGTPGCTGCHDHPACKSKNKTKGTHKLKSHDVVSNSRLISWRVMDRKPGLNFSGFSATGILDLLYNDHTNDDDDEVYNDVNEYDHVYYDNKAEIEIKEDDDENSDGNNDKMSFCDVGFVLDQVEGDEGWCLVEEM